MKATELTPIKEIFIGGSNVAAALGLSKYKTVRQLVNELKGNVEKMISNDVSLLRGRLFEKYAIEYLESTRGVVIDRKQHIITAGAATCHIDGYIGDEIVEIKTSAIRFDELPIEYILQVAWYLGLDNINGYKSKRATVFVFDGFFNCKEFVVEYDKDLFDTIDEKIGLFYEKYIVGDAEPPIDLNYVETLKDLSKDVVALNEEEIGFSIDELTEIKSRIKELEEKKAELEEKLKLAINNRECVYVGNKKVTYKLQSRETIDSKTLQKDLPDVYEKYKKINTFRVLRY
ncbi:MAG: hypothetical protein QW051_03745 [Candidatus Aenigmatarchaeota archaeon]